MKVLFVSKSGSGLGLAYKLVKEGHSVKFWIQDGRCRKKGEGFVERVVAWRPHVADADLLIFDSYGFGHLEEAVRRFGKPYLGCNMFADVLRVDTEKERVLLQRAGISTFSERTVGVRVTTTGWFNGRDWVRPFLYSFEEVEFLNEGLGREVECQGCVTVLAQDEPRLLSEGILKLTPVFKSVGYRGPVNLTTWVNSEGVWGYKLMPSFAYDSVEAMCEGLKEPLGDLLFEIAVGVKKDLQMYSDVNVAVRVSVPPYPFDQPTDAATAQHRVGINEGMMPHLYFNDASLTFKSDCAIVNCSASDGIVLKATAHGRDIKMARSRVYSMLDRINLEGKQYRTDIGQHFSSQWRNLVEWKAV